MRWLDGIMDPMDMSVHRLREMAKNREPGVLQSMGSQRVEQDLTTEQQMELTFIRFSLCSSSIFLVSVISRYFVFVVVDGTIFFSYSILECFADLL